MEISQDPLLSKKKTLSITISKRGGRIYQSPITYTPLSCTKYNGDTQPTTNIVTILE